MDKSLPLPFGYQVDWKLWSSIFFIH